MKGVRSKAYVTLVVLYRMASPRKHSPFVFLNLSDILQSIIRITHHTVVEVCTLYLMLSVFLQGENPVDIKT